MHIERRHENRDELCGPVNELRLLIVFDNDHFAIGRADDELIERPAVRGNRSIGIAEEIQRKDREEERDRNENAAQPEFIGPNREADEDDGDDKYCDEYVGAVAG